ncbi:helix-turn-helix transcriptional regulator [Patulibacter sp. NPDC049589]|uniref:helix-turn-helix transcriptional regulator n=1 Tax=Patulibacter sp. NPDC049589 TaxID=3154731 RepID=UPI00343C57B4
MSERSVPHLTAAASRLRTDAALVGVAPGRGATEPIDDLEAAASSVLRTVERVSGALAGPSGGGARPALVDVLVRGERLEERLLRAIRGDGARRYEDLDLGKSELDRCRDVQELVDRVCAIALQACGAVRAVVGLVHHEGWTGLRSAAADGAGPAPEVPPDALPLAGLAPELGAIATGRPAPAAGRPDGLPAPTAEPCAVVPLQVEGRVRALLHLVYAHQPLSADDLGRAEDFGRSVDHVYEVLDLRDRLDALTETTVRLRATVGSIAVDDEPPRALAPWSSASASAHRRSGSSPATDASRAGLTPRQRQTLELMLLGLSNAQIAERLVVGIPTVKSHVTAILRAAGATNRAEAIGRFLSSSDAP